MSSSLNIDGLANAALYTIYVLAAQLAEATSVDINQVIAGTRQIVDEGR